MGETSTNPEMAPGTQVLLTKENAQVFLAFRRHRDKFITMLSAGVFELDSGRAEVNVNNGVILNIHIHRMTYKRSGSTM